jgi:hypothetical protein
VGRRRLVPPLLVYALLPRQIKVRAPPSTLCSTTACGPGSWSVEHRRLVLIGTLALFIVGVFAFVKVPRQFFPLSNCAEILSISGTPKVPASPDRGCGEAPRTHSADDPDVVNYATTSVRDAAFFLLLVQQLTTVISKLSMTR